MRRELPAGMFGENFTIDGLLEQSTHIGDIFSVGSAEVVVTQPRLPCYKLGIRFESDDMVKRFLESRRTGFYVAVTREGDIGAGDKITGIRRDPNSVPVSEITRLYITKRYDQEDIACLRRVVTVSALPASWKNISARDHNPRARECRCRQLSMWPTAQGANLTDQRLATQHLWSLSCVTGREGAHNGCHRASIRRTESHVYTAGRQNSRFIRGRRTLRGRDFAFAR